MTTVSFELTGEMEQYAPDIQHFVSLMLEKLQKNAHKGRWENMGVLKAFWLLEHEVYELRCELNLRKGPHSSDTIVREAADVANFAMIIASIEKKI